MKYVRNGLVANPKSSFTCLPSFNLSKHLKEKKFLTDLIQDIGVCELNSNALIRVCLSKVDIKGFISFVIADSTTFALKIENVDITGFDGPSTFLLCWSNQRFHAQYYQPKILYSHKI